MINRVRSDEFDKGTLLIREYVVRYAILREAGG